MLRLLFTIFILFYVDNVMAGIQIVSKQEGGVLPFQYSDAVEGFYNREDRKRVYGVKVKTNLTKEQKDSFSSDSIDWIVENDVVFLGLGGSRSDFSFGDFEGIAEWTFEKKGIQTSGCKVGSAKLVGKKSNPPVDFPIGMTCGNNENTLTMLLSAPVDVELVESSLFELEGKGERWKFYEVPAAKKGSARIASFTFKSGDKQFEFVLLSPKDSKQISDDNKKSISNQTLSRFQNNIAFGMLGLKVDAGTSSFSDSKFVIKYSGLSNLFWDRIRIGGTFSQGFATGKKDKEIKYTDFKSFMGYSMKPSQFLEVSLRGFFMYVNITETSTQAGLQSAQVGGALNLDWFYSEKDRINFNIGMANFGSDVLKSHLETTLLYSRQIGDSQNPLWLGLGFTMQNFEALNATREKRKFSENDISVVFGF